jgi:hypothetical protein
MREGLLEGQELPDVGELTHVLCKVSNLRFATCCSFENLCPVTCPQSTCCMCFAGASCRHFWLRQSS